MRRRADETRFASAFSGSQRLHRDMYIWRPDAAISYGTVHAGKGLIDE